MSEKLHIGILGSRGIPNQYGGFEALAEELSARLAAEGHRVEVYTVHDHPVKERLWKGAGRILVRDPERRLGTFGQFLYDLRCNLDSRKRNFDVVLHLGYTSDSVWHWLWPKKSAHVVHMDGQEWQRPKYSRPVRRFLRFAEKLAARHHRHLVADSPVIKKYLQKKYNNPVVQIAYGAVIPSSYSEEVLTANGLVRGEYDLIVARMEPENHIEETIRAKIASMESAPLVIVANRNRLFRRLYRTYHSHPLIRFAGPVYDKTKVQSLRHFCRLYVHGHSAGGTNPSLLESMACGSPVVAHKNPFNEAVLGKDAWYFSSVEELSHVFFHHHPRLVVHRLENNLRKIKTYYTWESVNKDYEKLFHDACSAK